MLKMLTIFFKNGKKRGVTAKEKRFHSGAMWFPGGTGVAFRLWAVAPENPKYKKGAALNGSPFCFTANPDKEHEDVVSTNSGMP